MQKPRSSKSLTLALYLNAGLLATIALLLAGRGRSIPDTLNFAAPAFGQQAPQAIAGGAGFYLMPAQFSANAWGCYVMDVDAQTLIAYVYDPKNVGTLRLAAARSFAFDRQLKSYNTFPQPSDMESIVKLERDKSRMSDDATNNATNNAATKPIVPNE